MPTIRKQEVGPYLLVRPHRSTLVRIYTIHYSNKPDGRLATMVKVTAPDVGLPDEYGINCATCQAKKFYKERDRCLSWLGYHLVTKHPHS